MSEYDDKNMDWQTQDSATPALIEHWRNLRSHAHSSDSRLVTVSDFGKGTDSVSAEINPYPDILVQATVVLFGDRSAEGQVIAGIAVPWFEIVSQLERDPDFLFTIPWRKLEEIIAGAYQRDGWPEVVLTPRSGDRGRDVIATRPGVGSIRIVDQIKAYRRGHVVTADEVRSMLGVLSAEQNVSKGLITTTSLFAPGIEKDSGLSAFMPYRLELKDGEQLRRWLQELATSR
jgi:restriction system protein